MSSYSSNVWKQVKGCSDKDLKKALKKDGFEFYSRRSNISLYTHPDGRQVTIHPHPGKSYGPGLLKSILEDAGWTTDADLKRVGLA